MKKTEIYNLRPLDNHFVQIKGLATYVCYYCYLKCNNLLTAFRARVDH